MKPYSNATLRIGGDGLNPKVCSELLGIIPDKQWRKGEPFMISPGRMHEKHSGLWMYETENRVKSNNPFDPLPHVNHIIQVFSGKKMQFDKIRNDMKNVSVSIFITLGVPSVTYTLDKQTLETILAIGVDDMNYTFIGIENEE